jgi:hypothetical protein
MNQDEGKVTQYESRCAQLMPWPMAGNVGWRAQQRLLRTGCIRFLWGEGWGAILGSCT